MISIFDKVEKDIKKKWISIIFPLSSNTMDE